MESATVFVLLPLNYVEYYFAGYLITSCNPEWTTQSLNHTPPPSLNFCVVTSKIMSNNLQTVPALRKAIIVKMKAVSREEYIASMCIYH